jgi:hypothetical protein
LTQLSFSPPPATTSMTLRTWFGSLVLLSLFASVAPAATISFNFAPVGNSYLAFLPGDHPAVGREVTSAKIILDLEVADGSDAAFFFTNIAFPIDPFAGNDGGLVLLGEELGWSGDGTFNYFEETDRFNGTFIPVRFGAETPGEDFDGEILEGSRIEFTYVPEPSAMALFAVGAGAIVFTRKLRRS